MNLEGGLDNHDHGDADGCDVVDDDDDDYSNNGTNNSLFFTSWIYFVSVLSCAPEISCEDVAHTVASLPNRLGGSCIGAPHRRKALFVYLRGTVLKKWLHQFRTNTRQSSSWCHHCRGRQHEE